MERRRIKIGIVGVGNCASALIQGIYYYRERPTAEHEGLIFRKIGGFGAGDIEIVAAWDIDDRKVGKPLEEAIFALPNCTKVFFSNVPATGVTVRMGEVADGYSEHMADYPAERSFRLAEREADDVVATIRETGVQILVNYVPVGSEQAARYYAECALKAGVAFVNCIPVFIASDPAWAERFRARGIPIIGDDIKSQFGATIVHRILTNLCQNRGVTLRRTYQLNVGGNTDFLNMLNRSRLQSKKRSKTEAVQSQLDVPLTEENIHIGPSDYVPWLRDNKVCFIRMEGIGFGGVPFDLDLRLSVEDSPNSAGMVIDAIRFCKHALAKGTAGALLPPSAFLMKHPPVQMTDEQALAELKAFLTK